MNRRPNVLGIAIISAIYWGALIYWQWDALFGDDEAAQMTAFYAVAISLPYVGFIIWGTSTDLPEGVRELKFIGRGLKPAIWLSFFIGLAIWGWIDKDMVGFLLVGIALMGVMAGLCLTCLLYTGDANSRLYGLKRLVDVYPSITKPEGHVRFNSKLWTTTFVLIIYFTMTNVMIWGLSEATIDIFSSFRAIMAGASGSIMHLGIGPIVTGSIIMQLFAGAKIIKLDLGDSDDKQLYQGVQKILVMIMIPVESIPQVYGFLDASPELVLQFGQGWANAIIVSQLFIGSVLVFLLDELVSKWGIGSGISLFIAAGVAQSTFVGTLSPLSVAGGGYSLSNPPAGALPMIFYTLRTATFSEMVSVNGFESLLLGDASHPNAIIALLSSILVFLVVAVAESSKLELPLTHGKVRGHRGQYP
ncbi:MAG TPA: hypothetical protein EYQ80_02890, partial [Candidatus Poseidoniales archaeon]|nr:hypothetical protein [Candidatus Poseidoniales archaeon]